MLSSWTAVKQTPAMESVVERQYREYTRYLKPLRPLSFSDLEMMQSLMQCVDPEEVASVAQLLGNRRGVIRVTFRTSSGVERLEQAVQRRWLAIGDVPLGLVDDGGQFIVVTLDNVPHYVPDEQVEQEMSQFGVVAGCSKDYVEVRGCRIENERRNVLFTVLVDKAAVIDSELDMFGTTVYANAPYLEPSTPTTAAATSVKGTDSAESDARQQDRAPVPASHPHPAVTKRSGNRQPTTGKRSSMYRQTSAVGLESPEAHATPAVGDPRDSGPPVGEHPRPTEKAGGHGGGTTTSVPVRRQQSATGVDMSRQLAKRSEAFEQLSALLQ